jgi:hypothetical protein
MPIGLLVAVSHHLRRFELDIERFFSKESIKSTKSHRRFRLLAVAIVFDN